MWQDITLFHILLYADDLVVIAKTEDDFHILLYADDLVVIAKTEDDLIKRLNEWKDDNAENRGMRVNMNKTKVMISGERQKVTQKAVRWPCVCGRGVGNNSIQCTSCQKWIHRKCCGIKSSMYKAMKTFVCRGHMIPVTGDDANLELVDKFCYLGDMLSVDGDAVCVYAW